MKCENLQFDLSIYLDDYLSEDERALMDDHLAQCSSCTGKLADFQDLRNNFRAMARPEIPNYVLNSVRSAVAAELTTVETTPLFLFPKDSRDWLQKYLLPYGVGVVASLLFGFIVLGVLLSDVNVGKSNTEIAAVNSKYPSSIILTAPGRNSYDNFLIESEGYIDPREFANARISVSGESPSVNPTGALVALTRSLVRGEMKDEEVVVVADVFGNGLAQIAEVIEAPRHEQVLYDLDRALKNDPAFAPFVPASFDKRADSIQIVLRIQRVDVNVQGSKPNGKK